MLNEFASEDEDYSAIHSTAWFVQWKPKQRYQMLAVIILITYVISFTTPFYYPCLVPMKKDLQCEVWQISLSSYIYLIVNAITYPLWVSISNRYSRKRVLITCLLLYTASTFCTSLFSFNIYFVILFRTLTSAFGSGVLPVCKMILVEIVQPSIRGYSSTLLLINSFFTITVGPLISGMITQFFSWKITFLPLAVLSTLSFLLVLFFLPETLDPKKKRWTNPTESISLIFRNFELATVAILVVTETSCMYFIYLIIAIEFPIEFNLSPIEVGGCYFIVGAGYIIGGIPGGFLTTFLRKRFEFGGRLVMPVMLFMILALANLGIGVTLDFDSFWLTMSVVCVCCTVRTLMFYGAFSYCIELLPQQSQLVIDGIFILQFAFSAIFQFLGQGVGELSSRYDYAFAFVSFTMAVSGIPVIFVLIRRLVKQRTSEQTG